MLSPHQVFKSDQYFNLDIPRLANILCRLERFNAHTTTPISVGMHLIHCYLLADKLKKSDRIKQLVLYHDVPEAYYGDIPSYIKTRLGVEAEFQLDKVDREIYKELGIAWPKKREHDEVKEIDLTALTLEAKYGFETRFHPEDWPTPLLNSTEWIEDIDLCGTSYNIGLLTELLQQYQKDFT